MKAFRRVLLALACAIAPAAALAQSPAPAWPTKPVRIVVTFPPGGSSDLSARLVAPKLAERLGQPVVVENRPGAGGGIGLEAVAKAAADGYTIVLASAGGLTANPSLYPKLAYDPVRDFAPIGLFGTSPFVLIASDKLPAASAKDVVALAKARPGQLSYASGGNGTAMHLTGELFKSMTGSFIVHVPYRGSALAVTAAAAGETQLAIADIASAQGLAKSGRIKLLGVMGSQRSSLAPELPTLSESGVPGFESSGWFALLAPAGTPAPVVSRLNAEVMAVLKLPEVRQQFAVAGLEPLTSSPDELARLIRSETDKWSRVIKSSGAKID
jgi:tripartite-type tricarboxylate transporter receptor subunit TctC